MEGGYLIDGFPSVGFTSAIATESMIQTSQFSLAGIIDSDSFPPISLIKEGKPNYPTRIFVNDDLKVSVFLSYLTLHESLHRVVAKTMLNWAKKQKIELIVSSMAVKSLDGLEGIVAVGNTDSARIKLKKSGLKVLEYGTIPGIPGMLLNEGSMTNQDVIVILFHSDGTGPDFRSSAELCIGMSQLIPGTSCDIPLLQKEAAKAEQSIKETDEESRQLKDSIYR
ncbi:MAG: proteasome assembly chaperone family protein [Nitrosopumilaceae archaeon]|nr:MAG: proteasome assembly chaperone family protein [Nitrosopumilaceae archaeon]